MNELTVFPCGSFPTNTTTEAAGWVSSPRTGRCYPAAAESFFRLDLKKGMTYEDAVQLAGIMNGQLDAVGQTRILAPASEMPMSAGENGRPAS